MIKKEPALDAISAISIEGFKSFLDKQRIEIRPLTLLAGANSSGKSSALQPLLLLKQTLEAAIDTGPLELSGPHVRFSSAAQLLARQPGHGSVREFEIGLELNQTPFFLEKFRRTPEDRFDLVEMQMLSGDEILFLEPGMSTQELEEQIPKLKEVGERLGKARWEVTRDRCFLLITAKGSQVPISLSFSFLPQVYPRLALRSIIHVPGLRGNPERTYHTTVDAGYFLGDFTGYTASTIASWQQTADDRFSQLVDYLSSLGMASTVRAQAVDATRVELLVGRTLEARNPSDLVNIADVGFGVSQVLPVLVALLVAKPGQLVYLEQPELHLHPRAQQALAIVLAEAANRGVRVVAETHSSILIVAVQALVAEAKLSPDFVKLHWFQRDSRGATKVTSADLDQLGAYGDWPEDFGEVEAAVDNRYLDAVESRLSSPKKRANK
jgi:putative AbiEii toxin of type IV toxin-antitoxin system/AAA ATPase-like protein